MMNLFRLFAELRDELELRQGLAEAALLCKAPANDLRAMSMRAEDARRALDEFRRTFPPAPSIRGL